MALAFNKAKSFVERMVENGYSDSQIREALEENPFIQGDYRIDTVIFNPATFPVFRSMPHLLLEEIEKPEEEIVMCTNNFFKFYLGTDHIWKEKFEEYMRLSQEVERALERRLYDKDTLLEKYEQLVEYREFLHNKMVPVGRDLTKIRKFAFENDLICDVCRLDVLSGIRHYEAAKEAAEKRKKYLKKPGEQIEPIIPFSAFLIEYQTKFLVAILFETGYLAGTAEIFEKIGEKIYGLKKEDTYPESDYKGFFLRKDHRYF